MLGNWLTHNKLIGPWRFSVIEYDEKTEWSKCDIKSELKTVLEENTVDSDLLLEASRIVNWDWNRLYATFVTDSQPKSDELRKGKFGEVLHGTILEEFHKFEIPLKKFQYQITPGTSLHGTDMILFKKNDTAIELLLFVETKLNTTKSYSALVDAYKEILDAQNEKVPSYLKFVLKELKKTDPSLFALFLQYGIEVTPTDHFRIGGIYDTSIWMKEYLVSLTKVDKGSTPNLTIDVIKITSLNELVKQTYKELGVTIA